MRTEKMYSRKKVWWAAAIGLLFGLFLTLVVLWIIGVFGKCDVTPAPMDKTVQVEVMKTINGISALVDESFQNIVRNAPDSKFTNVKRSALEGETEEVVGNGISFQSEVMKPVDWETFFALRDTYLKTTNVFFTESIEEFRSCAKIDLNEYKSFCDKLKAVTWEK